MKKNTPVDTEFTTKSDAVFIAGHTRSLRDKNAPVWVHPRDVVPAGSVERHDARCSGCTSLHGFWQDDDFILVISEHEVGCPWFRNLLASVTDLERAR